jgi:iron complex transport system substrate-binding protein
MFFWGCRANFEHFGEFSIKYLEDGCKVTSDGIGRKLLLVPRGQEGPPGYKGMEKVEIPVKGVVIYSTTDAARLKALGVAGSIVGVTTRKKDWHIPEIKKGMEEGKVVFIGEYKSIDYEKLKVIKPDVVFTWDEGIIPKLEELGIPCVITSTKIAKDLSGHIGFIRFLSAFFGEEKKAKAFVKKQLERIDEVVAKTARAKKGLKAVWGDIYERKVLVEPGNSWPAQIVDKGGGNYIFHDLEGASCMEVTLEKFFSRTRDADILIIYRGPESGIASKEELYKSSRLLQTVAIKPMKGGKIYFTGHKLSQSADTAGIVGELASIFHPELFPGNKKYEYFYELPNK